MGGCLLLRFGYGLGDGHGSFWDAGFEFAEEGDELGDYFPVDEEVFPFLALGEDGEKLEELVDAFIDTFHVPKVERKVFGQSILGLDLALEVDEGAGFRDDALSKDCEYVADNVDIYTAGCISVYIASCPSVGASSRRHSLFSSEDLCEDLDDH